MDTERYGSQNLKRYLDRHQSNLNSINGKTEIQYENSYNDSMYIKKNTLSHNDEDDQNNSNTGYTEKLLKREFEQIQKKKEMMQKMLFLSKTN